MSTIEICKDNNAKSMCYPFNEVETCKDEDFRNEYDCSETSAKASSSSMHDSITNMSNSHSTPENDTFSENAAILSPVANKNQIKYEMTLNDLKECTTPPLQYYSDNSRIGSRSIDDTIESVLTKFRIDNEFKVNKVGKLPMRSSQNELTNFSPVSSHYDASSGIISSTPSYKVGNISNYPQQFYNDVNYGGFYLSQLTNMHQYAQYPSQPVRNHYMYHNVRQYPAYSNQYFYSNPSSSSIYNHKRTYPPQHLHHHFHHQNYQSNFKIPHSNSMSVEQNQPNNTSRKKRISTDKVSCNSNKKRKLSQNNNNNTQEDLLSKLKVVNYNSLLTNPQFQPTTTILPPQGYYPLNNNNNRRSQIKYSKYKSSIYNIDRTRCLLTASGADTASNDNNKTDLYIQKYVDNVRNDEKCIDKTSCTDEYLDIIQGSPDICNETRVACDSDEILLSNLIVASSSVSTSYYPLSVSPILSHSSLKQTAFISLPLSHKTASTSFKFSSQPNLALNFVQLSGSFLKRTKINGKTLSNIHIEEAISLNSLTNSSTNDSDNNYYSCHNCHNSATLTSCWSYCVDEDEKVIFCSSSCYYDYQFNKGRERSSNSTFNTSTNNLHQTTQVIIKPNTPYHKLIKTNKKVCDFDQYVRRRFPSEDGGSGGIGMTGISEACKLSNEAITSTSNINTTAAITTPHPIKHRFINSKYFHFNHLHQLKSLNKLIDKEDEKYLLNKYNCSYRHVECKEDERKCLLCHQIGDADEDVCGRLINIDADHWIHLNCALWCFDVFETVSGSLMELERSLERALKSICSYCNKQGAGIQCYRSKCTSIYHVPCAYKINCVFYTDRGMYCPTHAVLNHPMHLASLQVNRRVVAYRDESYLVASAVSNHNLDDHDCQLPTFRTGSLILNHIGQLLPEQLISGQFNSSSIIYPVGYHSTRIYWSLNDVNKRCKYQCHIDEANNAPLFRICINEVGYQPLQFTDISCDNLWKNILIKIAKSREESGLTRLFPLYLSGEQLFGLTEPHIIRVIESLPGVEMIKNYAFKFGKMQLITEMPLAINPTGSARTEPKLRTYVRRSQLHDSTIKLSQCGVLKVKSNNPIHYLYESLNSSKLLGCGSNSRSLQYKKMKHEWMDNIILSRSKIQGLGLLAARDMDKSTIIIEYIGELIRNEVANCRERMYEARNNSIYMFRLNEDCIIDATVEGGLARYINHSCNPNCIAETLSLDCGDRIVITTKQKVNKGDELTYDYKFDFADNSASRIPCLCGSINCRKWMN